MSFSLIVLRTSHPPVIRLLEPEKVPTARAQTPNSQPTSLPATPSAADSLSSLSLSSRPVVPKFGVASLGPQIPSQDSETDAMDWSPTDEASAKVAQSNFTQWFRPQRFFAPEHPTGLEDLLERTKLVEDVTMTDANELVSPGKRVHRALNRLKTRPYVSAFATVTILLTGVALRRRSALPLPVDTADSE